MKDIETGEYNTVTYDTLIDSMEIERLVEVSDDDYQGSTRVLVRDGDRFGMLEFGWGSCSGCDALQAVTYKDGVHPGHYELRDELWQGIHWEPNADAMLTYLRGRDWDLQWGSGGEFGRQAVAHLESAATQPAQEETQP